MSRIVRQLIAIAVLALTAIVGSTGPADAGSIEVCDLPLRDEPQGSADILCTRVKFARRLIVNTEFTVLAPASPTDAGTRYTAMLDPARKGVGRRFLLAVGVRADRTATAGRLSMATSVGAPFKRIRCADIRTRVPRGTDNLAISVPIRCLRQHTVLGSGIHVRLHSFAPDGGDFLPDRPGTLRVRRG